MMIYTHSVYFLFVCLFVWFGLFGERKKRGVSAVQHNAQVSVVLFVVSGYLCRFFVIPNVLKTFRLRTLFAPKYGNGLDAIMFRHGVKRYIQHVTFGQKPHVLQNNETYLAQGNELNGKYQLNDHKLGSLIVLKRKICFGRNGGVLIAVDVWILHHAQNGLALIIQNHL